MSEDYLDATIYGDGPRRITPDESERDVSIALSRPLVLLALRRKIGVPPVVLRAAGGINGWMPDINANGEIVSGAGEIFFGAQSLGIGTTPRWIDNDRFVYNSAVAPEKTGIRNARNGKLEAAIDPAYNQYSSGGGKWSGLWQGRPQVIARLYDAKTQKVLREAKNVCNFELAPNGSYAFYTGFDSKANTVFVNSGKSGAKDVKVFEGEVTVVAKTDGAVVICAATGTYSRRIVVVRDDAVIESSIHTWEDPIGVDVDDSTWVLSVTVDGIMLRKAGSTQGHYWPGEWFNPVIALSPERTIIIAASTGQGQPQHVEVDPTLSDYQKGSGVAGDGACVPVRGAPGVDTFPRRTPRYKTGGRGSFVRNYTRGVYTRNDQSYFHRS